MQLGTHHITEHHSTWQKMWPAGTHCKRSNQIQALESATSDYLYLTVYSNR